MTSLESATADDLFGSLSRLSTPGQALVGFDYPIGLPCAYGVQARISSFRDFLAEDLPFPPWDEFLNVAETVDQISIYRPFYPRAPGGTKREHLYNKLQLAAPQLRRQCERKDAETMFWTLGGKQVGKGALAGWALLTEALRAEDPPIGIWPFDGSLDELLDGGPGLIVAETYPRSYYTFVRPPNGPKAAWSKRRQEDRLTWVPTLLSWAQALDVQWEEAVLQRVTAGFSTGADGEDEFDAVVGLLAMIAVVAGVIPSGEPDDNTVRAIEGWILGRPCYLDVPMPDWFALEFQLPSGEWVDEAFCTPDRFSRNRDGSYLRWDGGSGLWIRATHIDQHGVIDHVDGDGEHHRYRLASLPNPRYPGLPDPRNDPRLG